MFAKVQTATAVLVCTLLAGCGASNDAPVPTADTPAEEKDVSVQQQPDAASPYNENPAQAKPVVPPRSSSPPGSPIPKNTTWPTDPGATAPNIATPNQPSLTPNKEHPSSRPVGKLRDLTGDSNDVESVCFSPDGKQVLSGSFDKTIRLWDVKTGRQTRQFSGNRGVVFCVRFLADGVRAVSGGYSVEENSGELILWDVATGTKIREFPGHNGSVKSVAVLPDGKHMVAAAHHSSRGIEEMILWNLDTANQVRRYDAKTPDVVAVSADGRRILTGGENTKLSVLDTETGKRVAEFEMHTGGINSVAILPRGDNAVSSSGIPDDVTILWNTKTGQPIRRFIGQSGRGLAVNRDGTQMLASGGTLLQQTIHLTDIATGEEIARFDAIDGLVKSIDISPDGLTAVSSNGKNVTLWSLPAQTTTKNALITTNDTWPPYTLDLGGGASKVTLDNPNTFAVLVGLRDRDAGVDFTAQPNETVSVTVPNGRYDVFFSYSSESNVVYQGDSFTVASQDATITLKTSPRGNYKIRKTE
jgi:WD40 repeat protein